MNLASTLSKVRKMREMKQVDAAKEAGISASYLSLVEHGRAEPSNDLIKKLAKIYNLEPALLMCLALRIGDVDKKKRGVYKQLKPVLDDLIYQVMEMPKK